MDRYPASFEAHAAGPILKQLAKAPRPTPTPAPRPGKRSYWVQVGAFSRKISATKLAARLKAHRYPARIKLGKLDWSSVYQVKVGPYRTEGERPRPWPSSWRPVKTYPIASRRNEA